MHPQYTFMPSNQVGLRYNLKVWQYLTDKGSHST